MKKIIVIGNGGHAKEVYTLIKSLSLENKLIGFSIPENLINQEFFLNKPIIPISKINKEIHKVTVAVGDPNLRREIVENELPKDLEYINLIASQSYIGSDNNIGKGVIIMPFCHITTNINIGDHSHLYSGTSIGHDSQLGNFFSSGAGVSISGNNKIGESVYFGNNSSIKQGLEVYDDVTIGMNSCVVNNIYEKGTYVGIPSKKIK